MRDESGRDWHVEAEALASGCHWRLHAEGGALTFRDYLAGLGTDHLFRRWYTRALAELPFDAFFWEHPPLTAAGLDAPAELVVLDAPALAGIEADPGPFRSEFDRCPDDDVVDFPNLGGDARLVAPTPHACREAAHLAAFLRQAPAAAVDALWARAVTVLQARLTDVPVWLSTSGLGVAWLHLRLDATPKYYHHLPYRQRPASGSGRHGGHRA
jgi:hypothetical protein